MNHMEIHAFERQIAEVLEHGFLRAPQPEGKGFDKADCIQAAHDIAESLMGNYRIDPHPYLNNDAPAGSHLEAVVQNLENLKTVLREAADASYASAEKIMGGAPWQGMGRP